MMIQTDIIFSTDLFLKRVQKKRKENTRKLTSKFIFLE